MDLLHGQMHGGAAPRVLTSPGTRTLVLRRLLHQAPGVAHARPSLEGRERGNESPEVATSATRTDAGTDGTAGPSSTTIQTDPSGLRRIGPGG